LPFYHERTLNAVFVDFSFVGKTFQLVDPFYGKTVRGMIASNYNRDPESVLRLFEGGPSNYTGNRHLLAFVYGGTGDVGTDVATLGFE
jgi:hypothetical protein